MKFKTYIQNIFGFAVVFLGKLILDKDLSNKRNRKVVKKLKLSHRYVNKSDIKWSCVL